MVDVLNPMRYFTGGQGILLVRAFPPVNINGSTVKVEFNLYEACAYLVTQYAPMCHRFPCELNPTELHTTLDTDFQFCVTMKGSESQVMVW